MRTRTRSLLWLAGAVIVLLIGQNVFFGQAPPEPAAAPAAVVSDPNAPFVPSVYRTFAAWKLACERLPRNRAIRHRLPPKELLPLKQFAQFEEVLDAFFALSKHGTLSQPDHWIDWSPAHSQFFNTDRVYYTRAIPFQPYAQKLSVPSNAEVILHGDFHGDVHSLLTGLDWLNKNDYLDGFKLQRPNLYMVFLGDYTDRGMDGVEVLYTLYRLKLANPEQVFLLRGNHEDLSLAASYGFVAEGTAKYGARAFNRDKVMRAYDFMPAVLYLGSGNNFIQCNHGGMEPGFDPGALLDADGAMRFQLLGALNQMSYLRDHPRWFASMEQSAKAVARAYLKDFAPESPVAPRTLGFMWNDFSLARGEPQLAYDVGRAFVFGEGAVKHLLDTASTERHRVHAVFRAHQHSSVINDMMRRLKVSHGIFRHWQEQDTVDMLNADEVKLARVLDTSKERSIPSGSVWTFNVAPDTYYGEGCNYDFDTFGILKVAERFEDWKLQVVNIPSAN